MLLGIEIGGTKLQLGVGRGDGSPLVELRRTKVDVARGGAAIRQQIAEMAPALVQKYDVRAVGIGFGGPVDGSGGRTITSHQVAGWDDFPLVDWCRQTLGLPAALANDSDSAGLAEALFGAGKGYRIVFYNNVGSGIGGALILDGRLHAGSCGIAAELGHMRPGPESLRPEQTVESIASGFGMAAAAQQHVHNAQGDKEAIADLVARAGGDAERISGKTVADAAAAGNAVALAVFNRGVRSLGWAIAQMITLVAPEIVVLGGGVPLASPWLFLDPLRREVERYVFPPLRQSYRIVPAALGEEVVVQGALAIARRQEGLS
jgi:glucokinase